MKTLQSVLITAVMMMMATACGPGLDVTSPAQDNVKVKRNDDGTVPISLTAEGWELRPAGECGAEKRCGHLVVMVTEDEQTGAHEWIGQRCGTEEDLLETAELDFEVDLSKCSRQTGLFSVQVSLHNDTHLMLEGGGVAAFRRFIVEE